MRQVKWFDLAGLLSCLLYLLLSLFSRGYADASFVVVISVILGTSLCWGAGLFIGFQRISTQRILFWAILFRAIGFTVFPPLEDDVFRYLWDGFANAELGGSYGTLPEDYFGQDVGDETANIKMEEVLDYISYPDTPTVYGPFVQCLFTLAYWLSPGNIFTLKFFLLIADIGLLYLVSKLTLSKTNLFLFAWCPLIVFQFSISAHIEIVAVMWIALALFLMTRGNITNVAVGLILSLAITSKVVAIIAVPFFVYRNYSLSIYVVLFTALIYLISYVAFGGLPEGLIVMSDQWQFNSSIFFLIALLSSANSAKVLWLALFAGLFCWMFWQFRALYRNLLSDTKDSHRTFSQLAVLPQLGRFGIDGLFAFFFLLSPIVNPWYWIWVLFFAVLVQRQWVWIASLSLFFSYLSGINIGTAFGDIDLYEIPVEFVVLEYVIIFSAFFWDVVCYPIRQNLWR